MKPLTRVSALVCLLPSAFACGPMFDDTILDDPIAALRLPVLPYTEQFLAIRPSDALPGLPTGLAHRHSWGDSASPPSLIDLECQELDDYWADLDLDHDLRDTFIDDYRTWRTALYDGVDVSEPYGNRVANELNDPGPFAHQAYLPEDIRRYLEGARAFRQGRTHAARGIWRTLLEMPPENRTHRTLWAVWMLAKTSRDYPTALDRYQQLLELGRDPRFADPLHFKASAAGWLAHNEKDLIRRLSLYHIATLAGRPDLIISVRQTSARILDPDRPELIARAAADPIARQLITADLASRSDHSHPSPQQPDQPEPFEITWLDALEATGEPLPNAPAAAWIAYSLSDFTRAERWLQLSPPQHPDRLWLEAKLALRQGKLPQAIELLRQVADQAAGDLDSRPDIIDEVPWLDGPARQHYRQGQLRGDLAICYLSHGEISKALDWMSRSGYFDDTCYIAERLASTTELLEWVRQRYPSWSESASSMNDPEVVSYWGSPGLTEGDRYRYLVGRRLTREGRYDQAREFIPPVLLTRFDHLAKLEELSRHSELPAFTRSAILWQKAEMLRQQGIDLLGTAGAPDFANMGGYFELYDLASLRINPSSWPSMDVTRWGDDGRISEPAETVPPIGAEEKRRIEANPDFPSKRFHYRYLASRTAWEAASLLPDNDPSQAWMHHTAGTWLASRDPEAADIHYKAFVRRNPNLLEARQADRRRWFLAELPKPGFFPSVPESLISPLPAPSSDP